MPKSPERKQVRLMRRTVAPDLQGRLVRIATALRFRHVDLRRVHCMRVYGSRANAYARIWGLPHIFQDALRVKAHYVIEVLMPAFDRLSRAQQDRVLIHELLHIPATFSGGLRPEKARGFSISNRIVNRLYRQYLLLGDNASEPSARRPARSSRAPFGRRTGG